MTYDAERQMTIFFLWGALKLQAEIIPNEPDTDNAGEGMINQ